jgi:hypothetical protein
MFAGALPGLVLSAAGQNSTFTEVHVRADSFASKDRSFGNRGAPLG